MASKGVLKCQQVSDRELEYQWTIPNFESYVTPISFPSFSICVSPAFCPIPKLPAQFFFRMECGKSMMNIGGSHYILKFCCELILKSIGTIPDSAKVSCETTFLDGEEKILEKGSNSDTYLNNYIHCLSVKRRYYTKVQNSVLEHIPTTLNVIIVKFHLKFLNHTINEWDQSVFTDTDTKALVRDLSELYNRETMAEVEFRIGEETLRANKVILIARSKVFQKLFEHDFVESTSNTITISDCNIHIFDCFLKYLYTGEISDTTLATVTGLYVLADKYDVECLRKSCCDIICFQLNSKNGDEVVESVCEILIMAYLQNDYKLKNAVSRFIVNNFSLVGRQQNWNELLISEPQLTSEILVNVSSTYKELLKKQTLSFFYKY